MATYFHEIPESREITVELMPTATTHWVCEGEFDDFTVATLARTSTPYTFVHPLAVLTRNLIEVHEAGHKLYYVTVHYNTETVELGSYRIEFDTLGGTVHIKAGVHQAVFPAGSPTHGGLIGVKGDDVEGSDIVIPAMRIIIHYSHPYGYLTDARIRTLSRAAGSMDNAGFFGWSAYETLFLGAQGMQETTFSTAGEDTVTEVSYHFAMSENLVNYIVGSIAGVSKKGWDVAWTKWRETVEGGKASNEAEYVNVVRVYREQSLKAVLGFG